MKKLIFAAALLAAGSSTVWAEGMAGQPFRYGRSGAPADRLGGYSSQSYGQGFYDYAPGYAFSGPQIYSSTDSGQPGPDSGIESQR